MTTPLPRRLAVALVLAASAVGYATKAAAPRAEGEADRKRAALWKALEAALPAEGRPIEAYAEDPALTSVLFRSGDRTLLFRLEGASGRFEETLHMRPVGPINRITFEKEDDGASWVLWHNGQRISTIGVAGGP